MVQGFGRKCAAARSRYAQTDHGGTGRYLQLCAIPWKEYSYFIQASPGGQLGSYGGRDRVGCEKSTEEQIGGGVRYEGQAPERVAHGIEAEEMRRGRGRGREDRQQRRGTNGT